MPQTNVTPLMHQLLLEQGFDFKDPSPRMAWSAFIQFINTPIVGVRTTTFGVAFSQYDDRDDILWLSFMRRMEMGGIGASCGCLMSRYVTQGFIGLQQSNWWWAEHGTVEEWIAEVEHMPAFNGLLTLSDWQWQGFSE